MDVTPWQRPMAFARCQRLRNRLDALRVTVWLYVRGQSCQARRELSGDVRAASGGQGTAAQWPREAQTTKSVLQEDCTWTRVKEP